MQESKAWGSRRAKQEMRVLNLYAGLGGNRMLWEDVEVTAVELRENIALNYKDDYPKDRLILGDAHDYLLHHFDEYDFIWSSPPCQSHSRAAAKGHNQTPSYPNMALYQEIIFLQTHAKCTWVVENVKPYYEPLIKAQQVGRHLFWSNFHILAEDISTPLFDSNRKGLEDWLGISYEGNIYYDGNHDPLQVLRNCVHPELGLAVLQSAMGIKPESVKQQSLEI